MLVPRDAQDKLNSRTEVHCDETIILWVVRDTQPAQLRPSIRSLFDKHRERAKQTSQHGLGAAAFAFDFLFCNSFH